MQSFTVLKIDSFLTAAGDRNRQIEYWYWRIFSAMIKKPVVCNRQAAGQILFVKK